MIKFNVSILTVDNVLFFYLFFFFTLMTYKQNNIFTITIRFCENYASRKKTYAFLKLVATDFNRQKKKKCDLLTVCISLSIIILFFLFTYSCSTKKNNTRVEKYTLEEKNNFLKEIRKLENRFILPTVLWDIRTNRVFD